MSDAIIVRLTELLYSAAGVCALFYRGSPVSDTCALGVPRDVVARLLKSAGATIESELRGRSMGRTLPHGSRLRVRFENRSQISPGEVVAFVAGANVIVHRVVARGLFGGARAYVLTRGDGALLLDHPVPQSAILGVVSEWKNGDEWQPVPPHVTGGARLLVGHALLWPTVAALHIHHRLAMTLTVGAITLVAVLRNGRRLFSGHGR